MYSSAFPKADPSAGAHILQQIYPNENMYHTITQIENARPWSGGADVAWMDMKASRSSLATLRSGLSTSFELTHPGHFPHYSRRSRGPTTYDYSIPLPNLHSSSSGSTLHSLSSSPSLRSLRLEQRQRARTGRSTATLLEQPPSSKALMASTPTPSKLVNPPWSDTQVAGLGYSSKFYYRA